MLPKIIEDKIDRTDTCWFWLAAIDRHGYGVIRWEGLAKRAHRVVYEILVGHTDLELDHLCNNPPCVNPEHLEPVTHQENVKRGWAGKYQKIKWAVPRSCPHGHPLSGDNLYLHHDKARGRINRQCRQCRRDNKRRLRAAGAKY